MADSSGALLAQVSEGILVLTLNRPQVRNALDPVLVEGLLDALERFEADPAVRVAIITGTDPAFCAGLDINAYGDANSPRHRVVELITRLPTVRKPMLAAVNGAAMTGGLELALGCDFVIASEQARFGDTHARISALSGSGLTAQLVSAVGIRWAKQMNLTALPLNADTALRIGLVNEVVTHAALLPRTLELARAIATHDPEVIRLAKRTLDHGHRAAMAETLAAERTALTEFKQSRPMTLKLSD